MKRKKPSDYLYHGSSNKNLSVLSPKRKSVRDEKEGRVIFATQNKALAATFIPRGASEEISVVGHKAVILIPNKRNFLKKDKGGAIYKIKKSKAFNNKHPTKYDFGRYEWIARRKIKPIEKKVYDSSIDAMIENKAMVYFVNKKQMRQWHKMLDDAEKKAKRNGKNGIPLERNAISGYLKKLTSENEKRKKMRT
jgi:hypothetical protein